jgi:hypothetical protein
MAVLEGGVSAALTGVGAESGSALHVVTKPTPVGALGHYRTSHRTVLVASQAANSRLFELQNAHATNLVVIHRVRIEHIQTAAQTAAILTSFDMYRCTAFSAVDSTATVTPVISKLRNSYATAGANVRGCTVAGVAAGMTAGTLTKDTAPLFQVGLWLLLAVPTGGPTAAVVYEYVPNISNGEAPLVLVQNEGFIIENRVLLGAAAGSAVSIDIEWSEVTAY